FYFSASSLSSLVSPHTDTDSLSLHAALPIYDFFDSSSTAEASLLRARKRARGRKTAQPVRCDALPLDSEAVDLAVLVFALHELRDRKSTRLNSSHVKISYAVFCLKKKKSHTQ